MSINTQLTEVSAALYDDYGVTTALYWVRSCKEAVLLAIDRHCGESH